MAGEIGVDAAADHHADDGVGSGIRAVECSGASSVAEDRDAIAEPKDFGEAVGDVDHRDSARHETPDQGEEVFGIGLGEGAGRLVKDENAGAGSDGPGDLHQLLVGGGKGAHVLSHVEASADVGQKLLGASFHFAAVDQKAESAGVISHAEVFGDGKIGAEGQFLVDHADPRGAGVGGRGEMALGAFDGDDAGVGAVDAGEEFSAGGFTRSVFADEAVAFAGGDGKGDCVQRGDAGKSFRYGSVVDH